MPRMPITTVDGIWLRRWRKRIPLTLPIVIVLTLPINSLAIIIELLTLDRPQNG